MSQYAAGMESQKFTDAQNRMILESPLPNPVLAERLGVNKRSIQRQRALLKKRLAAEVAPDGQ
jgi:hypothetical protein